MKSFINEHEGIISSGNECLYSKDVPGFSRVGSLGDICISVAFAQQDEEDWKGSNRTGNQLNLKSKFHLFKTKHPLLKHSLGMKIQILLPVYMQFKYAFTLSVGYR